MPDKTSMNIETKSGVIDLDSVKDNKTSPSQTINVMPDIKQKAREMLEKYIERPVNGSPIFAPVDEEEFDDFLKDFDKLIDEIIDIAVAERDKEINRKIELFACKVDARRLGANGFELRNLLSKPKLSAETLNIK